MGSDQKARRIPDRVVFWNGLRFEDVQGGSPDPLLVDGPDQSLLIHGAASAHVDDDGGLFHGSDPFFRQDPYSLRRSGQAHEKDIRQGKVGVDVRHGCRLVVDVSRRMAAAVNAGDVGGSASPDLLGIARADIAGPQDGHIGPVDGSHHQVITPDPALYVLHVFPFTPEDHEGGHQAVLGYGGTIGACRIGQDHVFLQKVFVLQVGVHAHGRSIIPFKEGRCFNKSRISSVNDLSVGAGRKGLLHAFIMLHPVSQGSALFNDPVNQGLIQDLLGHNDLFTHRPALPLPRHPLHTRNLPQECPLRELPFFRAFSFWVFPRGFFCSF